MSDALGNKLFIAPMLDS